MDTAVVWNSLIGVLTSPAFGVAGFTAVALAIYIWVRTRSTYLILSRLWGLFNGKNECKVLSIATYLDEQTALMQFRFLTGLRARTLKHAEKLIAWSRDHDEDLGDVAASGPHFDLDRPGLKDKLPGKWTGIGLILLTTSLLMCALVFGAGVFYDRAILQMNGSGTWFSMDKVTAKRFSDLPAIRLDKCSDAVSVSHATGFTVEDVRGICSMAAESGTTEYLRKTIVGQRKLSGVVGLYFWLLLIPSSAALLCYANAMDMKRRLNRRKAA